MRDYLFVQPFLAPPGGGEGVASWMLQALSERGRVTLLTWDSCDLEAVDRYYGTTLASAGLELRTVVPCWLSDALKRSRLPHEFLRLALLMGRAKLLRSGFRHCVSAFNELDLGGDALQYVHFPCQDLTKIARQSPEGSHHPLLLAAWPIYLRIALFVARWTPEGVTSNTTLANSWWTASHYHRMYGREVDDVIYPPPLNQTFPPSSGRRESFLSIGRVHGSKGWLKLIAIIEKVRDRGHDVGLTLAGSRGDEELLEKLESAAALRPWLDLRLDLPRAEMDALIVEHKYGLHGMCNEHYGMAVAELVLGGCLTMVPNDGGQVEIVTEPELRYESVDDAAEKIDRLLSDTALQSRLLAAQTERRPLYTRETFLQRLHGFLDRWESRPARQK